MVSHGAKIYLSVMPVILKADSNASIVSDIIRKYGEMFPKDVAIALSKTAKGAKDHLVLDLPNYIDRPTPFTKKGFYSFGATDKRLSAEVGTRAFDYYRGFHHLEAQVSGGSDKRALKGSERRLRVAGMLSRTEFLAPGPAMHLDQYGNIPGSKMAQLLSQIRTLSLKGQDGYSANRAEGEKSMAFFAVINGKKGIWERRGKRNIRLMAQAIKAPSYAPRLPMTEIVEAFFVANFEKNFWAEYQRGQSKRANKPL